MIQCPGGTLCALLVTPETCILNRRDAFTLSIAPAVALGGVATVAARNRSPIRSRSINPTAGAYSLAREVTGASRWLFISGQTPERADGSVAADFRSQCRDVWTNIETQLRDAGMTLDNLVKVTIFLADRRYRRENAEVRREVLGERTPALTIIIAGIYDESWLLEIEAIAAGD